ncbi:hypothetical protein [Pseudoxanthomonas sp. UTMC 1351]|uniref:hypothetical protein n=1 Tax=Pseudoxanthomonas sp. UTMC 1351 TaxID=2695853 RepID=UPI0034CF7697
MTSHPAENANPGGIRGLISRFLSAFQHARNTEDLVGKTVQPKYAQQYMGKVQFTGVGTVVSVGAITERQYRILLNHTIPSPLVTPTAEGNAARTPGECIINALAVANSHLSGKTHAEVVAVLKPTWLDGDLSRSAAVNALNLVKHQAGDMLAFHHAIDEIMASMESKINIPRRNDNFYGRLFETHLSEYVCKHPDSGMEAARDAVASRILMDFDTYGTEDAEDVCFEVAMKLRRDPVTWRAGAADIQDFIESPSPDRFRQMMRTTGPYSVPTVLSVAVGYMLEASGMSSIADEATRFYEAAILPQRKLVRSSAENVAAQTMHGLLLPYQRGAHDKQAASEGNGVRPMDRYVRPSQHTGITSNDWNALRSERTIAIGISGSANLLHYLFKDIRAQDESFPMESAQLATAGWLAHSGGHSFNEVYSVFGYERSGGVVPVSYDRLSLETYTANEAVEYAFDKVVSAATDLRQRQLQTVLRQ